MISRLRFATSWQTRSDVHGGQRCTKTITRLCISSYETLAFMTADIRHCSVYAHEIDKYTYHNATASYIAHLSPVKAISRISGH